MQVSCLIDANSVDALKGVAFQVQLQSGTGRQLAQLFSSLMHQFRCLRPELSPLPRVSRSLQFDFTILGILLQPLDAIGLVSDPRNSAANSLIRIIRTAEQITRIGCNSGTT
jgi:hypothetical protein